MSQRGFCNRSQIRLRSIKVAQNFPTRTGKSPLKLGFPTWKVGKYSTPSSEFTLGQSTQTRLGSLFSFHFVAWMFYAQTWHNFHFRIPTSKLTQMQFFSSDFPRHFISFPLSGVISEVAYLKKNKKTKLWLDTWLDRDVGVYSPHQMKNTSRQRQMWWCDAPRRIKP